LLKQSAHSPDKLPWAFSLIAQAKHIIHPGSSPWTALYIPLITIASVSALKYWAMLINLIRDNDFTRIIASKVRRSPVQTLGDES
jgi:hypothetical protein